MSRVLVVHADAELGAERASAIRRRGHEPIVARSGERAMDCFIQEPADVVVVDYQLEGRDGLSTAEAIRWMPGGRRARVVLTAASEPEGATLEELGRSVDAFRALVAPSPEALAGVVGEAASVRPHDAETRVLEVEQVLLAAERARSGPWEDTTTPGAGALRLEDETLDDLDREDWEWRDTDGRAEGREVRAIAESAATAESDVVGSFEAIPFARLLHRMAEKRATGALICVHPPDERATTEGSEPTKVVYFRAGVPVAVRSNVVAECLGQVLARTRRIGPATLRESLSAVSRGEGRQGEVLVRMGAIAALELSEALADQLRVKLFELFAWRRGTFRFAAEQPPPRELIDLGLGLAEIAFWGVREGMPAARVLERLKPDRERFVVPRPRELVRFVRLHVPEPLGAVIRAIDGTQRLRELLEASGDPAGAAQLVYAMACLSAVRFQDAPILPRALVPSEEEWESATPLEDPEDERWLAAPSAPKQTERGTRVVHAKEVEAGVGAGDIERGGRGDEGERGNGGERGGSELEVRERGVLDDERVCGDEGERGNGGERGGSELEVRERGVPGDDDEREPWVPGNDGRGGERERWVPGDGGERGEREVGPRVRAPEMELGDAPPSAIAPVLPPTSPERPAPKSGEGEGLPSDVPPADGTAVARPGARRAASAVSAPEGSDPHILDERVERLLAAERHFRRGQRALDRDKADEAVSAFGRAAELCPDQGQFLAYLGWATHAAAPDDALALDRALELAERGCIAAPELAVAHLLRARLLRAAGRADDSRAAFVRVLELDPSNAEARGSA